MFKPSRLIAMSLRSALRQLLATTLLLVVGAGPVAPLFAQAVPAAPMMLHITILDGEDSLNNIRERTAREPIVQVEDENHKPVAGALLIFSIQNGGTGASGTFNGLSTLSVTTDSEGKAIAHGLKPNATSGSYTIGVTATFGALVATAVIHQSNIAGAGGGGAAPPAAPVTPTTPIAPTAPETPAPSGGGVHSSLEGTEIHPPYPEEGLDHRHGRCRHRGRYRYRCSHPAEADPPPSHLAAERLGHSATLIQPAAGFCLGVAVCSRFGA